jgi:PAS domain S-box-containing protein
MVSSFLNRALTVLVVVSAIATTTMAHFALGDRAAILVLSSWAVAAGLMYWGARDRAGLDRAEAETALRRSTKALEDLKAALDQAAIVATTDVRGVITFVNNKFCEISQYSREELLGQTHRVINSGLHPPEFFRDLYQTIGGGRVWRGEIRNRAKDGSHYWVDTTIVPFLDETGHPYQHIAIRNDITERKRSEAALREQTSLAQLGKMAAVVAHEVRNPLAAIRGALQVIGSRMPPEGREHAVLRDVVARIDSLNEIVQDLLLFARPTRPSLARVPASSVIADTVTLFRQDPSFTGVQLRVEPTDAMIHADAQQVKQVLLNLLLNGSQAMNGQGTLTIATEAREGCRLIRIADEGPGIPPEVREQLFQPFFTTRHRGTGLGLVTARRLMEAQGGTVTIECPSSGGTVATVSVPAG